jgi:hypothetical protein
VDYLNQAPCSTGDWGLLERYPTKMYSSGEQKEVWIISRNRVVCAAGGGGGPSSGATGAGAAAAEPLVTPASAPNRKRAGPCSLASGPGGGPDRVCLGDLPASVLSDA